jgi:predicted RecB family nuclease
MQHVAGRFVFSPSDLHHFLECEHQVELHHTRPAGSGPHARDAHAELLAAKGLEHERASLRRFRDRGLRVVDIGVEIDGPPSERKWEEDAARTLAAMAAGADVIYQGVLVEDGWRGIADFLVRIDTPSARWAWSYEAWDTKLARQSKPSFVLQLCFYTAQVERLQGSAPARMHVILGTGDVESFLYADFASYYRAVRRRFRAALDAGLSTYPYPVAHCGLCEYTKACEARWTADDHLSLVAGITREQVRKLNEAGVDTVAQLAAMNSEARVGIGGVALDRLRHQAALQSDHRRTGAHRYELLPADERSGFRLLPERSAGDLFFDMEGDPYFEPAAGLEYLFGVLALEDGAPVFTALQALTREDERIAFEQFIDLVHARLRVWADLHVYHYAAYEITALKRLMSEHATREEELDDLLRREVFVDLYQVVRQSIRISHPSYSIKKVRQFTDWARDSGASEAGGAVSDGADSILEFERWRATGDPAILQAIIDYNRDDCVSTLHVRDWLLERKQDAERLAGASIPWKGNEPPKENTRRAEDDAITLRRREGLDALGVPGATLLGQLLNYHRREAKPEWWAYYDRQKKSLDDLVDDTQAIAYLAPLEGAVPEAAKKSLVHTLVFPDQEIKLGPDPRSQVEDPFRKESAGTIESLEASPGRLRLKRGPKHAGTKPPVAIVAGKPLPTDAQRDAIGRVAAALLDGRDEHRAVRALLARDVPRRQGETAGQPLQTLDLEQQIALVRALDSSCLVIQGPPGSGKTWTAARLVVTLIAAGRRVGVTATSHKAINNLLAEIERVASAGGITFDGLKKGSDDDAFRGRLVRDTDSNEECETADVALIAGTSWLFSRERMDQRLDYLFVDEAGQVSLADAVATGASARNLVFLGDPQQLPQVRQGIHPCRSGCSVLEHLLDGAATVPEDRGLFLARTWRLHPDVCSFISDLSYQGRLASAPGCERQRIDSPGLSGTGLRYLPVTHTGNAQRAPEEARKIAEHVRLLLAGGTFTDPQGVTRPLTPADILVVAPYNMQVGCLREELPAGVEAGTVDKFQGREAPVVFFSLASSSGQDVPRGLEFLFSRHRFNVAISRARALAVIACSPTLIEVPCRSVDQMRLLDAFCRFLERAAVPAPGEPR